MGSIENTVFISYRHTNIYLAKAIYDDLRANGHDVFIDYEGIKSGDFEQACFESLCGNTDKALELLKIAVDKGQFTKEWIQQDPHFEGIRHDHRFKKLFGEYPLVSNIYFILFEPIIYQGSGLFNNIAYLTRSAFTLRSANF